jgi:hypothetical protein
MCLPWALARLRPSAVRVRIRSRSTSARPPRTASINRPVLLVLPAHGSAKDRNCALASTMRLTDAKQIEGAVGDAVNARHRHHVAGGELAEQPGKLAPVGQRARQLLAVDVPVAASGGAQMLKLAPRFRRDEVRHPSPRHRDEFVAALGGPRVPSHDPASRAAHCYGDPRRMRDRG